MIRRTLLIPDVHFPFEDPRALRLVEDFAADWRPHRLVCLGDLMDFGSVSSFAQDPTREVGVQDQVDHTRAWLSKMRAKHKGAEFDYVEGNHEVRLQKYVVRNARSLAGLRAADGSDYISVPNLLGLQKLGIRWIPDGDKIDLHGTIVEHGDRASSYSGYTAKRMLDARRVAGVSGHTHRAGVYCFTPYNGDAGGQGWIEAGWLGDHKSHAFQYASTKNWQHGFAVSEFDESSGMHQVSLVRVQDTGFIWAGKVWSKHGEVVGVEKAA